MNVSGHTKIYPKSDVELAHTRFDLVETPFKYDAKEKGNNAYTKQQEKERKKKEEQEILLNNASEQRSKIIDLENNIELLKNNLSEENKELVDNLATEN